MENSYGYMNRINEWRKGNRKMAFCENCGTKLEENARFCPECGKAVEEALQVVTPPAVRQQADKVSVTDKVSATNAGVKKGKVMAFLSYTGILVLIPWFVEKENPFVRFHARQGMLVFLSEIVLGIFAMISLMIFMNISFVVGGVLLTVLSISNMVLCIIAIKGMVHAVKGQVKELPLIGKINIFK